MSVINAARIGIALTLIAHVSALILSELSARSTPISQLSRGDYGTVHTIGLLSLALAWGVLIRPLWQLDTARLWRLGCTLLVASIGALIYVAYYFATADDATLFGEQANDPLSVLASALGVAMGAMQPALKQLNRLAAQVNLTILILWLALIPVIPFLETQWLGAYERTVGILMLVWSWLLTGLVADTPSALSPMNRH